MIADEHANGLNYLLFLPPNFAKEKKHPVLLFLHGSGGLNLNEKNIRGQSLGRMLSTPDFAAGVEHIVIIPMAPARPWSLHFPLVMALLDDKLAELGGDPSRVAVSGQSIGGNGTWELAATNPDRFCAAAPVCGFAERDGSAPPALISTLASSRLPIWTFHAASDAAVQVENTDVIVEALKAAGSSVKYTRYETAPPCVLDSGGEIVGHGSYELAYKDPELWKWLLEQRRA